MNWHGEFLNCEIDDCSDSQYQFGIQLLQSADAQESLFEALRCINVAAQRGHPHAQQLLTQLQDSVNQR